MVHDIRQDLFAHLQVLPFSYYDNRPHGKILVRIVHYVNNVSDVLSNGLLDFIIEIINIIFIIFFMFQVSVPLAAVTTAGLPVLIVFILIIKPKQRRAYQVISNKNSNLNAYVQESIEGVKVTQAFNRQETNLGILDRLIAERYRAWMHAIYISNSVWFHHRDDLADRVFACLHCGRLFPASYGILRRVACHGHLCVPFLAADCEPGEYLQQICGCHGVPGAYL